VLGAGGAREQRNQGRHLLPPLLGLRRFALGYYLTGRVRTGPPDCATSRPLAAIQATVRLSAGMRGNPDTVRLSISVACVGEPGARDRWILSGGGADDPSRGLAAARPHVLCDLGKRPPARSQIGGGHRGGVGRHGGVRLEASARAAGTPRIFAALVNRPEEHSPAGDDQGNQEGAM